jgi:uncharacterized protein (DUF1697 family)
MTPTKTQHPLPIDYIACKYDQSSVFVIRAHHSSKLLHRANPIQVWKIDDEARIDISFHSEALILEKLANLYTL